MTKSSVKFHEYIPFSLGVIDWTLFFTTNAHSHRVKELRPGHNSKTELAKCVVLDRDTLSQDDFALCEVS